MAIHFTPAQQKVLDAREHNILVSAAAGSGKTAVLVERIVRLCSEGPDPLDIDRLLVVTFTRAAAAQMRERIGQALSARLAQDPHNTHLQAQEVLLHNAQITTMDSFFTFLLRNYFSDIDLDPGFRQIDPTESRLLGAEVLRQFLEDRYAEKDPAFLRCVDYFCTGPDDRELEQLILGLCDQAGSHPSPEAWLFDRAGDYDVPDEEALFETPWMRSLVVRSVQLLADCDSQYAAMEDLCLQPGGPDAAYAFLEEERQGIFGPLRGFVGASGEVAGSLRDLWEAVRTALSWQHGRYPALRGKKYAHIDPAVRDTVKSMRDAQKDRVTRLRALAAGQDPQRILTSMAAAREPLQTLSALAVQYWRLFQDAKRERHVIDFVDLEHYALDILAERQEDGSYVPRRAARALRSHYAEILIDEYQDSNEVQELLLQIISGEDDGRYNRFMVGDIKQSIYRFRLARPEIFMEKYDAYRPDDAQTERIELDQNFRSRGEVLDCVNAVFLHIMRREVGGVDYDENVSLKQGAAFPDVHDPSPYAAELLLLDTEAAADQGGGSGSGAEPEEEEETEGSGPILTNEAHALTDRQKEALLIASRIRELVGTLMVWDEEAGGMRPARYGDIVILLRSTVGWNEDLRAVFAREGIPVYAESRTGYFAAEEIRVVLEMLRVMDNPRQDIPLYGALRGYYGNFTQDEIAGIRLAKRDGQLYDALLEAAEDREGAGPALAAKCRDFLSFLESWRSRARYSSVSEIVTGLLEETGYTEYCTALPAGVQRTANLRLLRGQADAFTKTEYTGLFQFLRYIDGLHQQEIDYGEANTLDENADVVRIMSIHKSKGLEFPVCFVAGLSKGFAFRHFDASGPMLYDGDWGAGIYYFDPAARVRATTLRREEIAEKIRRDCMGEELRVLYVALTRAKEKLIMTASMKGFTGKLRTWQTKMAGFFHEAQTGRAGRKLTPAMIGGASSFAELVCEAVYAHSGPDAFDDALYPGTNCPADPAMEAGMAADSSYEKAPLKARLLYTQDLVLHRIEEQAGLSQIEERLRAMEGRPLSQQPDPEAAQRLADRIFRVYPHGELRDLFAQTSVSELKHRAMQAAYADSADASGEGAKELFPDPVPVPYVPAFIRREGQAPAKEGEPEGEAEALLPAAGGARRGTAFHRVLELMEYSRIEEFAGGRRAAAGKPPATVGIEGFGSRSALQMAGPGAAHEGGPDPLEDWLLRLPDSGKIAAEDARLVSVRQLRAFLCSPLAGRMAAADRRGDLYREQPFVLGCPADRVGEGLPHDEMITVQGIIDAFLIEDGQITLIDYKTDRVQDPEELVLRYRTQLMLYAEALEKGFGMPVREKILYSTALGTEIRL